MHATELRMQYDTGELSNPMSAALDLVARHRNSGEVGDVSDTEVSTCLYLLIDCSRLEVGREILNEYLGRKRRSRAPLARVLREQIDRLARIPCPANM